MFLHRQVLRITRGIRRDDTTVPQLSLPVLAIAWPSLHRGSGSGVPRKIGRCRPSLPSRADSSADLPKVLLALRAFAVVRAGDASACRTCVCGGGGVRNGNNDDAIASAIAV